MTYHINSLVAHMFQVKMGSELVKSRDISNPRCLGGCLVILTNQGRSIEPARRNY